MLDRTSAARNDPRYQQAFTSMQMGRWKDAVALLEALLADYPNDGSALSALDTAKLKASFETGTRVRARRWQFSWRSFIFRSIAILAIAGVLVMGYLLVKTSVLPALAQSRAERQKAVLLTQAQAYLKAGELDKAEKDFSSLLLQEPNFPEALAGLTQIQQQREIESLYEQGVTAQEKGDIAAAVTAFETLALASPGYRDITSRLLILKQKQDITELFNAAEQAFSSGNNQEAVDKYLQIKLLNASYESVEIAERLFTIYMRLGRALIEKRPASSTDVSTAVDYFTNALIYRPRDPSALQEQRFALLFIKGQSAYQEARWHDATFQLKILYDSQPDYLGTSLVEMLYDAYIHSGDLYLQEDDVYRAYDAYQSASQLPISDLTLAKGRLAQVLPVVTPSPVPTETPTPRPTTTSGGGIRPTSSPKTPTPEPTPTASGLASFTNKIVFISDNPGQSGLWVMAPDGSDRRYLGNSSDLLAQYDELVRKYQFSSDQRSMVYVMGPKASAQIFITIQAPSSGATTSQITSQRGANYDPSWSPDGTTIVYVSQDTGSDDIWIMAINGDDKVNLTPNNYYDKHPSWSPDSRSITFWSNSAGGQQIFVMFADGSGMRNISNSPWKEYDPVWIR